MPRPDAILSSALVFGERAACQTQKPSLEEFTQVVLSDDWVEEMRGVDHTRHMEGMSPEEREEHERAMEARAFFSGARVKLRPFLDP